MWFELSMEKINGELEEIDQVFNFMGSVEGVADDMSEMLDSDSKPIYKGYLIHAHFGI